MSRFSKLLLFCAAFALLLSYTTIACATHPANMNSIEGKVTDETHRPIQGVGIGIDHTTAKGPIPELLPISNEEGKFAWPALPPGTYTLRATLDGYQSQTQTVEVKEGATAKVEFVLQRAN